MNTLHKLMYHVCCASTQVYQARPPHTLNMIIEEGIAPQTSHYCISLVSRPHPLRGKGLVTMERFLRSAKSAVMWLEWNKPLQSHSQPTTLCRGWWAGNETEMRRALVLTFSCDTVIHCQDNNVKQQSDWVTWQQDNQGIALQLLDLPLGEGEVWE